jgi:drug/metabolite transporter (DMT)-like permease
MRRGALFMMLSALAFSVMTVLVKLAGQRLPSQELVVARAAVSLVLSWWMLARAGVSPWGEQRRWLWLRGALGFGGLSCVYAAVTHLPLAEATVLQYLHPPITALLAGLFLAERVSPRIGVAMGLSLGGVILVAQPAWLFEGAGEPLPPIWVAAAIGGACFSAAAYVVVRKLAQAGEHPLVIVFYFPLVTLPAALPTLWPEFVWPRGIEWLWLLGIGVATQIGQVSLTRGLAILPAAHGTALSYLQVAFAALWGVLVFGELPDAFAVLGGGLVVGSALWLSLGRRA